MQVLKNKKFNLHQGAIIITFSNIVVRVSKNLMSNPSQTIGGTLQNKCSGGTSSDDTWQAEFEDAGISNLNHERA